MRLNKRYQGGGGVGNPPNPIVSELGTPSSPPKETLLEDLGELLLSIYPPTALAGAALGLDDAEYAVRDMIQNPEDIGFNRGTLENLLDIAGVIPYVKAPSKAIDLGKGAFQLAKRSKDFTSLMNALQSAGFLSDRAQEEEQPRAAYTPRRAEEIPPLKAPASLRRLPPRLIPYKSVPYSMIRPALPSVDISVSPYIAERDKTRTRSLTLNQ